MSPGEAISGLFGPDRYVDSGQRALTAIFRARIVSSELLPNGAGYVWQHAWREQYTDAATGISHDLPLGYGRYGTLSPLIHPAQEINGTRIGDDEQVWIRWRGYVNGAGWHEICAPASADITYYEDHTTTLGPGVSWNFNITNIADVTTNIFTITADTFGYIPYFTFGTTTIVSFPGGVILPTFPTKPTAHLATVAPLPDVSYTNGTLGSGAQLIADDDGALTIDGELAIVGFRYLIKDQVDQSHNGLYIADDVGSGITPFILTRDESMDVTNTYVGGVVPVTDGDDNHETFWFVQELSPPTVGTDPVTFAQSRALAIPTYHLETGGSTPTAAPGAGAGTGGTAAIAGANDTDSAGEVSVTTGTGALVGVLWDLVVVTYDVAFNDPPSVTLTPSESNAGALTEVYVESLASHFNIKTAAGSNLADATQYNWYWTAVGRPN